MVPIIFKLKWNVPSNRICHNSTDVVPSHDCILFNVRNAVFVFNFFANLAYQRNFFANCAFYVVSVPWKFVPIDTIVIFMDSLSRTHVQNYSTNNNLTSLAHWAKSWLYKNLFDFLWVMITLVLFSWIQGDENDVYSPWVVFCRPRSLKFTLHSHRQTTWSQHWDVLFLFHLEFAIDRQSSSRAWLIMDLLFYV